MATTRRPDPTKAAITFPIESDRDIGAIRICVRNLATRIGFLATAQISIVTAVSELGHDILESGGGELVLSMMVAADGRKGIQAVGRDRKTARIEPSDGDPGSLGLRLSGARRIVDEFEIADSPGGGTTVILRKWHS